MLLWWIELKFISKYSWIPRIFWLWCNITPTFLASPACDNKYSCSSFCSTNCCGLKIAPLKVSSNYFWVFPWTRNRSLEVFLPELLIMCLYSFPYSASLMASCSSEPTFVHPHLPLPHHYLFTFPPLVSPLLPLFIPTGHVSTATVGHKASDSLLFASIWSLT